MELLSQTYWNLFFKNYSSYLLSGIRSAKDERFSAGGSSGAADTLGDFSHPMDCLVWPFQVFYLSLFQSTLTLQSSTLESSPTLPSSDWSQTSCSVALALGETDALATDFVLHVFHILPSWQGHWSSRHYEVHTHWHSAHFLCFCLALSF